MSKRSLPGRRRRLEREDSMKLRKQGKLPLMGSRDLVYVRDDKYSWLPAKIISTGHLSAKVAINLPLDWYDKTIQPKKGMNNEERNINLRDYIGHELPIQNFHDDVDMSTTGKADMTDLFYLHDASILYNLRDRHYSGFPYTRVGDIMIAVNPFQWIDGLYSVETQAYYANKLIWEEAEKNQQFSDSGSEPQIGKSTNLEDYKPLSYPPHIYETASLAYKGLAIDGEDQTILVTGESGAGKTETVKLVMSYLATLQSTHPDYESSDAVSLYSSSNSESEKSIHSMVNRIIMSNPIFEAFGNAKTVRNSNSSRFGKFTRLKFSVSDNIIDLNGRKVPNCRLIGSEYETYLLEKSRVANLNDGERLYHIFYQLLGAPEKEKTVIWEGLKNKTTSSFRYFGKSTIEDIDGVSDRDNWLTTIKALYSIGITGYHFLSLMRTLCLVLQFGNLMFIADPSSPETSTLISNTEELQKVAELMGVPEDMLAISLTQRSVKASWEEINFSLSPSDAKEGCDALAKEMYSLIFDYLVRAIDSTTNRCEEVSRASSDSTGVISLLDIYGFECFKINRFEQLCINYANERLQQKYVFDVFNEIKTEYEEEGIQVFDFNAIDNMDILHLIEGKPGILSILNEECVLPRGNDTSFVFKVKTVNRMSKSLIKNSLFAPHEFAIAHFSGPVKYDATKFVDRNKDSLPIDLINVALKSTNILIATEFSRREQRIAQEQVGSHVKSRKGVGSTVASKFKSQLTALVKTIEHTRTRYIRCIKPNAEELPRVTDNVMTMNQLTSAGVTTAVTIWRETYPKHLLFEQVLERFQCLAVINMKEALDNKGKASMLLSMLFEGKYRVVGNQIITPYACGKSKVFFRSGSLELLESSRIKLFSQSSIILQKKVRGIIARDRYSVLRQGFIRLQTIFRTMVLRREYISIRKKIILIQSILRVSVAQSRFKKLFYEKVAINVQKRWRAKISQRRFNAIKNATLTIQRAIRNRNSRIVSKRDIESFQKSRKLVELPTDTHRVEVNQIPLLRKEILSLQQQVENQRNILKLREETIEQLSESNRAEGKIFQEKTEKLADDNTKLRSRIDGMQETYNKQISEYKIELLHTRQETSKKIDELEKEGAASEVEIQNLNERIFKLANESDADREDNSNLRKMIDTMQKSLDKQRKDHTEKLFIFKEDTEKRIENFEQEAVANVNEISLLNQKISELSKERDLQKQDNFELQEKIEHIQESLNFQVNEYQDKIIHVNEENESNLKVMSLLNDKISKISKEYNFQKEENKALHKTMEELQESHIAQISGYENALTTLEKEKDTKINILSKESAANEAEISLLNSRMSKISKEFDLKIDENTSLQKKIEEQEQSQKERISNHRDEIIQVQEKNNKKIDELEKECAANEKEVILLNERISELLKQCDRLNEDNVAMQERIKHVKQSRDAEIKEFQNKVITLRQEKSKKINEMEKENASNEVEISLLNRRISEISKECDVQREDSTKMRKAIDDLHKTYKKQIDEYKIELATSLEQKNMMIVEFEKKAESYELDLSLSEERISELSKERDLQRRDNSKLEKTIEHMTQSRDIQVSDYNSELKNLREEKNKKMAELEEQNATNVMEMSLLKKKISELSKQSDLQKRESSILRDSMEKLQESHNGQITAYEDALTSAEKDKNKKIDDLEKENEELRTKYEAETNAIKIDMLNNRAIHNRDLAAYKKEVRRLVKEHEEELDRMFQLLDAAQRADLIIQSIDEHTRRKLT